MAELEDRLERLEIELAALKASIGGSPSDPKLRTPEQISEPDLSNVTELTQALFGGPVRIAHVEDPEIQNDVRVVFNVTATGSIDEILAREAEWHSRLFEIGLESPSLYCLSIDTR